tara:strand:+ start:643 stop:1476 length:834 start_codon:yes stop_codon:yes gene_type:complete
MKSSIALCRLDKPIGIYLIFWPALAAAVISTDVISNLDVLAFIMIGSILVRSIGCVINDIFDKDIDSKVERTKSRPLASSQLTTLEGWIIFAILGICILALLIQTNLQTIIVSSIFGCMIILYPLMKRFFLGPQLFLGITFNPIFIVHAITESITLGSFIFFFSIFCWVVAYDTYYGLCDIDDDRKLGINSTPIWWKTRTQNLIFVFQFLFVASLYFVGNFYDLSNYWIIALLVISLFFVYQSHLAKNNEYLSAFKNNNLVGMILCLFLLFEIYFIQ